MRAVYNIGYTRTLQLIKIKIEEIAYDRLKDKQRGKLRRAAIVANRTSWAEMAALEEELSHRRRLARGTVPCCITCRRRL